MSDAAMTRDPVPRTKDGIVTIGPAHLCERWHRDGGMCLVADATDEGIAAILAATTEREAPDDAS